jgi:YD repeat-containing protein
VAGTGTAGFNGDARAATQAQLRYPVGVAVDAQGNLYVADASNSRVRKVGPAGIITTVAGGGTSSADGVPAVSASVRNPNGLAFDGQGNLYIANAYSTWYGYTGGIRKVASALPGFSSQDLAIPSADGSELYEFTNSGRHSRTVHTLTGATRYSFSYDSAGRLASVTDGDGNVTRIDRDGAGQPTAVVAPFGQRTALTMDANGYLASITDPAGNGTQGTYSSDGLLQTFTDPRGNVSRFTYDTAGRVTREEGAAGGIKALASTATTSNTTTTVTTGLNRVSTYLVETLPSGSTHRRDTAPDGTRTDLLIGADTSRTTTASDGTVTTLLQGPDPRFGMQAAIPNAVTVRLPSGLTSTVGMTRTVTLSPTRLPSMAARPPAFMTPRRWRSPKKARRIALLPRPSMRKDE